MTEENPGAGVCVVQNVLARHLGTVGDSSRPDS